MDDNYEGKDYEGKDYEYYLLGCRSVGVEPVEPWRFQVFQEAYLLHTAQAEPDPRSDQIPPFVLEQLATLVAEGYKIAAGRSAEGDEPGASACGVREPRTPLEPVLVGCAARSLPSPNAPDESFWRT